MLPMTVQHHANQETRVESRRLNAVNETIVRECSRLSPRFSASHTKYLHQCEATTSNMVRFNKKNTKAPTTLSMPNVNYGTVVPQATKGKGCTSFRILTNKLVRK